MSSSSKKKSGNSVTLKDVIDSHPKEDEAETRVLRSIEQDDEEKGNVSAGILPGVKETGSHAFVSSKSYAPSETETVEESLFGLSHQMKQQSQKEESDKKKKRKKNWFQAENDVLAQNAGKLLGKARSVDTAEETDKSYSKFKTFMSSRRDSLRWYLKVAVLYLIIPGLGLTCFLFYAVNNPTASGADKASSSWWINFVFVRNVCTLSLAKGVEAVIIDFCCLSTTISMRLLGPFVTLALAQSKGWPAQLLLWGVLNFAMLYGDGAFARHWLFYQVSIEVFNDKNPAGTVLEATAWQDILISAVVAGGAVDIKRLVVSIWYGQAVYRQYGKDLASIMNKCVLVGEVAALIKDKKAASAKHFDLDYYDKIQQCENDVGNEDMTEDEDDDEDMRASKLLIPNLGKKDIYSGGLSASQKAKIEDLLGEWEEPVIDDRKVEKAPISAIVSFRAAVETIDNDYPFSQDFGLADMREKCIDSSQKLFLRLTKNEKDSGIVKFDRIGMVAVKKDGTLDETKLKDLIAIFRPTRTGEISMLDFVKSIDNVYKELRITRASIFNAQKMNAASQRLLNIVFYFCLFFIILAILNIDPVALLAGAIGLIVGFAFMIGGASSKYFEGLLLVLVRKPYDIGDRIAVSAVTADVSGSGSSGWVVKDLDLFKTTVVFGGTNEEATYSNGSLASTRIINHARSPKAFLNFTVKFGIDAPQEKIKAFGEAVEQFVRDRPREWLAFAAFRLSSVEPDQGFVQYIVVMAHREGWQQVGALLTSKAEVQLYSYELSKEMKMGYESPAMPIILSSRDDNNNQGGSANGSGDEMIEREIAMTMAH